MTKDPQVMLIKMILFNDLIKLIFKIMARLLIEVRILSCRYQKVRKTSPPKKTKLMNMKNMKISNNLCNYYSLVSSIPFPALGAAPFELFEPKISSQVKLSVKRAGKRPRPITNPLLA